MLQKLRIFYFSGTGNAKRIAHWFSAQATESMVECKLFNIADFKDHTVTGIATDELIIIISATHGFNYPKITLDFIGRFPKANNSVVLMNTRAGMKIGRFITPGLSGIALMLSSVILRNKGYKIVGKVPFDMPSNWLSIHPALSANAIQYMHKANYERLKAIWQKIHQLQIVDTAKKDIVQDLLIAPVALAYYFAGRFILAKSFYASAGCDNCGACIKQCPVQAIKLIHNRPYWTFRCESCMHCMSICPKKAVNTAHGLMLFVSILSSTAMTTLFYKYVVNDTISSFAHFLWFSGLFVLLLWVFYFLQHLIFKNKLFNKLISLLSLTHYKCWGRYKSIADSKWGKK